MADPDVPQEAAHRYPWQTTTDDPPPLSCETALAWASILTVGLCVSIVCVQVLAIVERELDGALRGGALPDVGSWSRIRSGLSCAMAGLVAGVFARRVGGLRPRRLAPMAALALVVAVAAISTRWGGSTWREEVAPEQCRVRLISWYRIPGLGLRVTPVHEEEEVIGLRDVSKSTVLSALGARGLVTLRSLLVAARVIDDQAPPRWLLKGAHPQEEPALGEPFSIADWGKDLHAMALFAPRRAGRVWREVRAAVERGDLELAARLLGDEARTLSLLRWVDRPPELGVHLAPGEGALLEDELDLLEERFTPHVGVLVERATGSEIQPGDLIVDLDGHAIRDWVELRLALSSKRAGENVIVTVVRAGEVRFVGVTLR